jgi:hypothetical protein
VLLARLAARAVEVGVDLGHRAGIVNVGGWMIGIVVVAGRRLEKFARSLQTCFSIRLERGCGPQFRRRSFGLARLHEKRDSGSGAARSELISR